MGFFKDKPKEGVQFLKSGNKIKVVETSRNPETGKFEEHEEYFRPTDKKLQKLAEKEFKKKGSLYYSGTIVRKADVGGTLGGLKDLFSTRGQSQKGRVTPGQPVNRDGSPRTSWW